MALCSWSPQRRIRLAWDANPAGDNVLNYNAYYGTASGVYGTPVDVSIVTTYDLLVFGSAATRFIALKAENAQGESASYSNEVSG